MSSKSMPLSNLKDTENLLNVTLLEAFAYERSLQWEKTVKAYRRILRILKEISLLNNTIWLSTLIYECEYHLAVALQNGGENEKSIKHFTNTLQAIFVPKNGCAAGCSTNSCLITPVFARRSIAYAKNKNLKLCLRDAEKSVVLDSINPDVFCVRAMAFSSCNNYEKALRDLGTALKLNPNHVCSLLLKGNLKRKMKPVYEEDDNVEDKDKINSEHRRAVLINPECINYFHVCGMTENDSLEFYEKFLYSLSIPHTINRIILPNYIFQQRPKSIKKTNLQNLYESPLKFQQPKLEQSKPIRCGTASDYRQSAGASHRLQRRKEYGESVRKCREEYNCENLSESVISKSGRSTACSNRSIRTVSTTSTNNSNKTISAFERSVNLNDIARMYIKPWKGDVLPAADLPDRLEKYITPIFKL